MKRPCVDETLLETTVQFQLLRRVFAATALARADRDGSYAAVGSIGPVVVSVGSAGRDWAWPSGRRADFCLFDHWSLCPASLASVTRASLPPARSPSAAHRLGHLRLSSASFHFPDSLHRQMQQIKMLIGRDSAEIRGWAHGILSWDYQCLEPTAFPVKTKTVVTPSGLYTY